jgi:predicted transport protein
VSDIKLFRLARSLAQEIHATASDLEKPLQTLIEANLEPLLAIRFLATEFSTGRSHAGRIDTLGLDEDASPVIIEYKRSSGENVINQGLFYLDWLMDNKAAFKLLVLEQFDKKTADEIDWSSPRLICIAADFTKYDGYAVQQIDRNIELIRYRRFGEDLLLLELVNAVAAESPTGRKTKAVKGIGTDKTVQQWFADMSPQMKSVFESLLGFVTSLGDDVQRKDLKLYVAFKRLKNFATVCFHKNHLLIYLRLNPDEIDLVDGFTRDVRSIGHWGTGQVEVTIRDLSDLDRAKPLITAAYDGSTHAS